MQSLLSGELLKLQLREFWGNLKRVVEILVGHKNGLKVNVIVLKLLGRLVTISKHILPIPWPTLQPNEDLIDLILNGFD